MNKDIKISNIQIRALIVSTIIGIGVLGLPNQLAVAMEKDGWIAIILSGLLTIPVILVINQIFKDNPGKDFFEIGESNLGKILFTICLIIYLAYYLAVGAYISRVLGEIINGFLLLETPLGLITFTFIVSIAYLVVSEIDIIARISYMTYGLTIGFALILILLAIPGADLTNILPMIQSDIRQLPEGIKVALFSFAGFEVLLFAIPFAEDKKRLTKTSISGIVIVIVLYLVLFLVTLTQLSIQQIKSDPFPLLMVAKLINLPGYFLQNLDGLVTAIWVIIIFSTMASVYYSSSKILSKIFRAKSHKASVLILIPVIYFLAFLPKNVIQINNIMSNVVIYLAMIVIFLIPFILFMVGRIKRRIRQ